MGKPVTGPVTEIGIVFQQHLLLPWRTIINNVLLQIEVFILMDEPFGVLDALTRDQMALDFHVFRVMKG